VKLSDSSPSSPPTHGLRILVADRNRMESQLLAEFLARDPRFEVVAVATAADVFSIATTRQPHVALISADLDSTAKKGFQIARNIHSRHSSIHIVMLLETSSRESVIGAFRCGAAGVFCRKDPLPELPACIERVGRGELWVRSSQSQFLLEALRSAPSFDGIEAAKIDLLSPRELQVAEAAAQGQSNKQIANQLTLSEHTIKNYLIRIFEKLGVSNRIELLFQLFSECNDRASTGRVGVRSGGESDNSIQTYLKNAQEGVVAAQFIVGLAYLEGYGVEKDERSAYYWLRMAEENSSTIRSRSHALIEELRNTVKPDDIAAVEDTVAIAVQDNRMLKSKRPAEFIKPSVDSAPIRIARKSSLGRKARVAS
jgi:two-component system nitrate/nitrite response regulator NarL